MTGEVDILILGVIFGVITPSFEEFLFRGYIWGRIENSAVMQKSNMLTLITFTLLFSVWHLGYLDVFLLHPLGMANLNMLIMSKLGIGIFLGLIVGYLRLKTGKHTFHFFSMDFGMFLTLKN